MSPEPLHVAIIGAGPYGLSIAAHLPTDKVRFRIFGTPMSSWRNHMPGGTFLKSDGFASSLFDPRASFTLAHYCAEHGIPYDKVGLPVSIETFVAYGLEFQRRLVPQLEQTNIVSVSRAPHGFNLVTEQGETVAAQRVVVAAGITHFGYIPPQLAELASDRVTHSSQHPGPHPFSQPQSRRRRCRRLRRRSRRPAPRSRRRGLAPRPPRRHRLPHPALRASPTQGPHPPSPLRPRPRLALPPLHRRPPRLPRPCPSSLRMKVVQRHLGPAPGWFAKDKVTGKVTMHLGTRIQRAEVRDNTIHIKFVDKDGAEESLAVDHLIAATGYKVKLSRLHFLDEPLRTAMKSIDDTPILASNFESSVPGLYLVGLASSNSFGPLTRFAYGAGFTAKRIARHLTAAAR